MASRETPALRRGLVAVGLAAALVGAGAATLPAGATPREATVSVGGAVGNATTYSRAALAALPQTTVPVTAYGLAGHTVTGVSVESVVQAAGPAVDPAVKNGLLRVRVAVTGANGRSVTAALGELNPSFGNHPALLVLAVDGRALPHVAFGFPGDATLLRAVSDVRSLTVSVATAPSPLPSPPEGAVIVKGPHRTVTLTASTLQRLPSRTISVTYTAGTTVETHTETGPQLEFVLLAAGIVPSSTTSVTAVATDGYLATVTPGESISGARTLLIALAQDGVALPRPRLVAGGDVKGGRYVSGVVELDVTR